MVTTASLSSTLVILLVLSTSTTCSLRLDVPIEKSNSIRTFANPSSAKSSCTDRPLDARQRDADAVMSGTVRRLDPEHLVRHGGGEVSTWRARIEVKRIIKGENIVSRFTDRDATSDSTFVWIVGIGDRRICKSMVRLHDTKIFMVKLVDNELHLNSSIVGVTLDNIDHADAIAHNKPFVPKSSTEFEDPCRRVLCPFWAVCAVSPTTNQPECRCPTTCSTVFAPVCGSDNVTYSNECHMRVASCSQRKRIVESYPGSCDVRDPCSGKTCSFGARCVASLDGHVARCQCPEICSSYGDSVGSTPVCGTDGVDYPNACELQKAACREMKDIGVKYEGKCDPCSGHECQQQVCQLDDHRRPVCRCGAHHCPPGEYGPVCGTDGLTYATECFMLSTACRTRSDIRVLFHGECSSAKGNANPCPPNRCRGPHESCRATVSGGRARCVCPTEDNPCEPVMRPVCASDGLTYLNECEMNQKACMSKKTLVVRSRGPCPRDGPCKNYQCQSGAICVEKHGQPSCVCQSCTDEFQPVCGTDGVSYSNECKLKAENCETASDVKVKYMGMCTSCENKRCDFYSICEDDGHGVAKCVCPSDCAQVNQPVCGTDGQTYTNECEMRVACCRKQQFIVKQSEGSCDACAQVVCRHGAHCENGRCVCPLQCPDLPSGNLVSSLTSVCASDGVSYASECAMRLAACHLAKDLEIIHAGQCESDDSALEGSGSGDVCDETTCRFGGVCQFDSLGFHGCTCNFSCEAIRSEVCGSDGKVYGSECLLRQESCKRQVEIIIQPLDICEAIDEELCDGKPPLVSANTGLEYNCDDGRDSCPAGSYCHKTAAAARCCPEDRQVSSCHDTAFGCCQDGQTPAPGPNKTGCPSFCLCNVLGSLSQTCDPTTRQCTCKPGVGGVRCDRCEPGYWGLQKIAGGSSGCTPCGCSRLGSVRDDCEQMTGRCMCRPEVTGQKCTLCANGNQLVASGSCEDEAFVAKSCAELECLHGARCVTKSDGTPECLCNATVCDADGSEEAPTCGTDGMMYGSECQLRLVACRLQKDIRVAARGSCVKDPSAIQKPNRPVTTQRLPFIGDVCDTDGDCPINHSSCTDGICICDIGYDASNDGGICKAKSTTTPPFTRPSKPTTQQNTMPTTARPSPPTTKTTTTPTTTTTTTTTTPTPVPSKPRRTKPTTRATTSVTELPTTTPTTTQPTTVTTPTTTTPTTTKATTVTTTTTTTTLPTTAKPTTVVTSAKTAPPSSTAPAPAAPVPDEITIPQFTGDSSLEIPIKKKVGQTFSYEIWLLTNSPNGLVLYGSQSGTPQGDFLSLNLVNGFVQLRFNLGSGIANITSANRIALNTWHRVSINRTDQTGSLQVNNETPVSGVSKGNAKELNLQMKLYIGKYGGGYNPSAGVTAGFDGAIQRIIESGTPMDRLVKGALSVQGVTQYTGRPCFDPTGAGVCLNGGQCTAMLNEFDCVCVPPFTGKTCASFPSEAVDEDGPVSFDGFTQYSYFNAISKKEPSQKKNRYVLRFSTNVDSGLLLVQAKGASVRDDYLAIAVVNGQVEAGYNLGKQSPNNLFTLRSNEYVSDGEWHTVVFTRELVKAELFVDEEEKVSGSSAAGTNDLNTDGMLWIGGKPNTLAGLSNAYQKGFEGCIEFVQIDSARLHLVNDRKNVEYPVAFCDSVV